MDLLAILLTLVDDQMEEHRERKKYYKKYERAFHVYEIDVSDIFYDDRLQPKKRSKTGR